jgi:hypothetical protein
MLWMALGSAALSAYYRQQMVDHFQNRIHMLQAEDPSHSNLEDMRERVVFFRKRRNQYFWGMAVLYLYAVGDGVVDAILNDFDRGDKYALAPGSEPFSLVLSYRF